MNKKIHSLIGRVLFTTALTTIFLTGLGLGSADAFAGSRSHKKIGLDLGLITEPFPSLLGYNLSYNVFDQLRLTAGYGTVSSTGAGYSMDVKTIGVDAKLFLLNWSFAPFVSLGYTSVSGTVSGVGTSGGISLSGTGKSAHYGIGVDWQTWAGFNLGLEYKNLVGSSLGTTGAPGLYIGWFF